MIFPKKHPAFARLPKKLTISFPIWGLFDTPGETAAYHDLDQFVREHVERGFNCIRLDGGAGLTHDKNGIPLGPVAIGDPFGQYSCVLRQMNCTGDGGKCDILERLISLCKSAKKHGVYLILSSWYYLHTFWLLHDEQINATLFSIPPHQRFMFFAQQLDYILLELEKQGLDDSIAFAEIFNEADGLFFINSYGRNRLDKEELEQFRNEHEAAISMLQKKHPHILFAFDSYSPWADPNQIPRNLQVFNFHNYFMWDVYRNTIEKMPEFSTDILTPEDVRQTRAGRRPTEDDLLSCAVDHVGRDCAESETFKSTPIPRLKEDYAYFLSDLSTWYARIAVYYNLDRTKFPEIESLLEKTLQENYFTYLEEINKKLDKVSKFREAFPDIPIVCGEGVSYIGSKHLLWEEKSETYWHLVEQAILKYKKFGLWGTVIRTCCGPEDPCWTMCPNRLRQINELFLAEDG